MRGLMESTGNRNKYPKPITTLVDEALRKIETPATYAALREIRAKVLDGYRVVPIVPTAEMLRVGGNVYEYCEENGEYRDDAARGIYSIMIAAAPAPGDEK